MDAEECFNAKRAVQFGFADGILYVDNITRRPVMNLSNLHEQRSALWEKAQAFMNSRTELSAEDCAVYERMDADIAALGKQIEMMERHREMKDQLSAPTSKPLVSKPGATLPAPKDGYSEAFGMCCAGAGSAMFFPLAPTLPAVIWCQKNSPISWWKR